MADSSPSARAQRKREQIRDAARRLFLQQGFDGTSMDAIMAAAGVASKETLYRYYSNKEELFADVLRHLTLAHPGNRALMDSTRSVRTPQELRTLLASLAQELLASMMRPDYLALIRLIMADLPRFPHLGELFRATVPEQAMAYLVAMLAQAREHGVVRADTDLDAVARMLIGALMTYALFGGLFRGIEAPQLPEIARTDAIVSLLMKALTSE